MPRIETKPQPEGDKEVKGTIHNCFLWQATKEAAIMSANSIAELDAISVNYPD